MKTFIVTPCVAYSGGCAIVAANDVAQALRLVNESDAKYSANYIDLQCTQCPTLFTDVKESRVIADTIYVEEI